MKYHYKPLLVVPLLLLLLGGGILVSGYQQTGEWFLRSIDLKGGSVISFQGSISPETTQMLEERGARIRSTGGFSGEGVLIEFSTDIPPEDILALIEKDESEVTFSTIGSSLGETFWRQAQIGIAAAFVLMGIVVFFLFRKVIPSFAVIFAAVADIMVTLALMQVFGIPLSLAGLAALLMLIGYSVDTDILLTSRIFKGEGSVNERLFNAFKTGMTMSLTTLAVLLILFFAGISSVITQIASVLLIGLVLDIVNTWLMNAGILRWYVERRSM